MDIEQFANKMNVRPIGSRETPNPIESEEGNRYELMDFLCAVVSEIDMIKRRTGIGIANLSQQDGIDVYAVNERATVRKYRRK